MAIWSGSIILWWPEEHREATLSVGGAISSGEKFVYCRV